jgi:predicted PhzF superfamily epimerase YddE/YHI9
MCLAVGLTGPHPPTVEGISMSLPLFQVDAFADRPFSGNPAAVCLLPGPADAVWMQHVAAEMNLSETAFLHSEGDAYRLRWFAPAAEVDLCGHATLASAHVLWEQGRLCPEQPARFQTRSGLLTAVRRGDAVELDFPGKPAEACTTPEGLLEALAVLPRFFGKSQFDYVVELESEAAVRAVTPDFARLAALPVRGIIVTASAAPPFDFMSRFFCPAVGVNEDPATGSSHCTLGPFWRERLGKDEMTAFQASPRGGVIGVAVTGARVRLRGKAVTVLRGELLA